MGTVGDDVYKEGYYEAIMMIWDVDYFRIDKNLDEKGSAGNGDTHRVFRLTGSIC